MTCEAQCVSLIRAYLCSVATPGIRQTLAMLAAHECALLRANCARADEGKEYYIDPTTKERTSQRPEEEAWISLYDDDRERSYYLNEVTNVRVCVF